MVFHNLDDEKSAGTEGFLQSTTGITTIIWDGMPSESLGTWWLIPRLVSGL